MIAQVLLLVALIIPFDAEHVEMNRNNGEIQVNVDGREYRMIHPIIGEAWEYRPGKE